MHERSPAAIGLGVALSLFVVGCRALREEKHVPPRSQATFCVATAGDDAGPGTADQPFATLARARDAVRQLVAAGLAKDVKVLLRGGTHYLPQGIAFGPEDSGTAEHRVAYAAWPGEAPLLVGGVAVTGWTKHAESIWQAAIPEGIQPTQLFENGERLALARAPNEGYFHTENAVPGQPKAAFVYRAKDLEPKGWDWSEGRVFMWPTHDWFSTDKPIAGIDAEKRIIRLQGEGGYEIRANNRYFVQNLLALLDTPGECAISLKQRRLCVWPRKTPIEQQTLVAASAPSLIAIRGEGERIVRNLHFEGLDLSIANGDVVSITGAEDCSIRFCKIENGTQCGVAITGHAQRIALYGNLIRFHGLHGVTLQGHGPGQPDVNHHHAVENNHIHHCGRLVGHGYGVRISQSGHNRIVHNHIHHMPRYAATIKGTRYQVLKTQVKGVTFENRHDFLHSRNNTIAYNHIHHVNQDSQDTGALESWGPGRDNVYDHNLIHDVGNTRLTLQSGLYLDDATDYFTVTNNVIYGVTGAGGDQPIYAKGIGNRIVNNILVVAPANVSAIRSFFMADERCDSHEYVRNIIVFEGARGALYDFNNWSDDRVAASDHNLFWRPDGKVTIKGGPANGSYDKWRALLGGKFDAHSLVADPLFHDLAGRDFRLRPDSPALKLGFQPIDLSAVGLEPDFPARFERE
ncbi:MAG TPA: right-handed parallel beta-helix repeat-containing protein [Planctomycetota bacterium]|nr:right-handed parallel beta-helix repeat-containing protein [Planctomycetota bacterium]